MESTWARFQQYLFRDEALGFALDISRMRFPDDFFDRMQAPMAEAFAAMRALEAGAIANPDEHRRVGHYWLRAPELAPEPEIRREIEVAQAAIRAFAEEVRTGAVAPQGGGRFRFLLQIGIGGSALGPQFLAHALGGPETRHSRARPDAGPDRFLLLDNTDPQGFERVFVEIGDRLDETLVVVASKSGGTKETRNGMLETAARFRAAGLEFARHAVAVTCPGSELDRHAAAQGWLRRFPMWDWVGGRTSLFSAVGLLPAALLGIDMDALLRGAREMDAVTRVEEVRRNPAALLALMWHHAGRGHGEKDMVVLPYRDRLELFGRYLQQLVMESLGKAFDLQGRRVHQGLVVYGNKGTTDQHAFVQQLREGPDNFFVTFIEALEDGEGPWLEVEPGITSGDYLHGFLLGTRQALAEAGRESLTITLERLDAAAVGRLVALFERAVGLYAALIGINAYHQPGVEAGKRAAQAVLALQGRAVAALRDGQPRSGRPLSAAEVAELAGAAEETESVYRLLRRLAANPGRGVRRIPGASPAEDRFAVE